MTYHDYMIDHDEENLSWCKPYADKSGDYRLVIYDGELMSIMSPDREAHRWDGSLTDELLEAFARAVNPDYDMYNGYTDLEIALDATHPVGCSSCPWFDDCDTMGEEMHIGDYR